RGARGAGVTVQAALSSGAACVAVASLSLALACSADGAGKSTHDGPNAGGSSSSGGGSSSGGSSSSGGNMASVGIGTLAQACGTSAMAHPQLRRLTASELQHSLDDIFPQLQGKWATGLAEVASPLGFNNDPALLTVSQQVA